MLGLSVGTRNQLTQPPITLCKLYKLTLGDGTIYRFTDHDRHIVVQGPTDTGVQTYQASEALLASAVENSSGSVAPNLDLRVMYVDGLTRNQMVSGLLDNARIIISITSWKNPSACVIPIHKGKLQRKDVDDKKQGTWGVKGLIKETDGLIVELFSEECRNQLGDIHCGVDLDGFTKTFTVDSVQSANQQFTAQFSETFPTGYFTIGYCQLDGDTYPIEILNDEALGSNKMRITLVVPKFEVIEVGMIGAAVAGCKKRLITDCLQKFNNILNYRGEPFNPTDNVATTGQVV